MSMRHLGIAVMLAISALAGTANAAHLDKDTFTTADLIIPSVQGILTEDCGGYCVVGACAHLRWRLTWRGIRWYTIVSPKIRHGMPVLLVSSYDHPGEEPYAEWRASFGSVISSAGDALGVAGGQEDPREMDVHQSVDFKEVNVIGHPLASLPDMVDRGGSSGMPPLRESSPFVPPNTDGRHTVTIDGEDADVNVEAMASSMLDGALGSGMGTIMARYRDAMTVLRSIEIIDDVREAAEYFRNIAAFMEAVSLATETSVRSSIYGMLINPRFQVPRLLCPSNIRSLQPYYLSFTDAFWWRAGYPVTDGPISGSDHSASILTPFSGDTLPVDANPLNPLDEVWGHLYPREGTLNQSHDAKTASVIAWRGMDVLLNSVPAPRIGIALPEGMRESGWSVDLDHPRWQMIHPEVKSCQPTPYYASSDPTVDFMHINGKYGNYAWNYYRTYTCCSNKRGRLVMTIDLPIPLCISAIEVFASDEDD